MRGVALVRGDGELGGLEVSGGWRGGGGVGGWGGG